MVSNETDVAIAGFKGFGEGGYLSARHGLSSALDAAAQTPDGTPDSPFGGETDQTRADPSTPRVVREPPTRPVPKQGHKTFGVSGNGCKGAKRNSDGRLIREGRD
eukprot:2455485-Pyramimonas_sp.AAC.1